MKSLLIFFSIFGVILGQRNIFYDEIKNIPNNPHVLLIELKEFYEIEATGMIPGSIHIPREIIGNNFIIYEFITP